MTTRLLLAAMIGLTTGAALRHAPRDWPEHALALARRMTYDSRQSGTKLPTTAERPVRVEKAPLGLKSSRDAARYDAQPDCVNPAATFNDSGTPVKREHGTSSVPAVTSFLRMLGLPRMRTTVELRDL